MSTTENLPVANSTEPLDFGWGGYFQVNMGDMGRVDSLRFTTMSYVVEEKYEEAVQAVVRYIDSKKDYPQFKVKAAPLVRHCTDLIYAIRSKRSLPGLGNLSASRQQEIFDRAREHFEELKQTLIRMEQIEMDLRRSDLRSTIWVLNALTISIFSLVAFGFTQELTDGLLKSLLFVISGTVNEIMAFFSI